MGQQEQCLLVNSKKWNLNIISLYNDFLDDSKIEQNGAIGIAEFNRKYWRSSLRLLDFITGDVKGQQLPEPYTTQKVKDWASHLLITYPKQVESGKVSKPSDYYKYEHGFVIGSTTDDNCNDSVSGCDTPITLLDSGVFDARCNSFIEGKKPSMTNPISKLVGDEFIFSPKDLGSISIYYYKYPKRGEVKTKMDTVYNIEVVDEATSVDDDWPEYARELLVYFLLQTYGLGTRERSLTELNENKGPLVRK